MKKKWGEKNEKNKNSVDLDINDFAEGSSKTSVRFPPTALITTAGGISWTWWYCCNRYYCQMYYLDLMILLQ